MVEIIAVNRRALVLLTFITVLLYAGIGAAQTEWKKHPDGAVLNVGAPGEWDSTRGRPKSDVLLYPQVRDKPSARS